jgi:hypothetical protein
MLVWNEFEFIECLEVIPEKDEEYETNHVFRIAKDGLSLVLALYQYSGDVYFDLFRDGIENPIFQMRLLDCPGARFVKAKDNREYLEFAPAQSFAGRYDGVEAIPFGIRLAVNPHINIELF